MKPIDTLAIGSGISSGIIMSDSIEQIVASAGAAVAVYLAKILIGWLARKMGGRSPE